MKKVVRVIRHTFEMFGINIVKETPPKSQYDVLLKLMSVE
jgi:hypothetical protein